MKMNIRTMLFLFVIAIIAICCGQPVRAVGLRGEYFDNSDLTVRKVIRTDATVDFNWGAGSPDPSIDASSYSAFWSGTVTPLYSETYTFYTLSADGVQLWVNGQLVVNNWTDHTLVEDSGTIALSAGQAYDIELAYYENGAGDGQISLSWSSNSQTKQVIPSSQLNPRSMVSSTDLPVNSWNGTLGQYDLKWEQEVCGASGSTSHVLRVSDSGKLVSWKDTQGNIQVGDTVDPPLQILDANGTCIFPDDSATVSVSQATDLVTITATRSDGTQLIYTVQPNSVGITVVGLSPFTVVGKTSIRGEGARIVTPTTTYFPTAGLGAIGDATQTIVDAKRPLALQLTPPAGTNITYTWMPGDFGQYTGEYLQWNATCTTGQTFSWCCVTPPALTGAVTVGMYSKYNFIENILMVNATLSSDRLNTGSPITISLSADINSVVSNGVLKAALFPVAPTDPVDASEKDSYYYERYDQYHRQMIPVTLTGTGPTWTLAPTSATGVGAYRLRLWIVPNTTLFPEALNGPAGAVVGYFPGFTGRHNTITTVYPIGDAIVVVTPAVSNSLTVKHPALRGNFWRGENMQMLIQARGTDTSVSANVAITHDASGIVVATRTVTVNLTNGQGVKEISLDTRNLTPGAYTATATASGYLANAYAFTIAPARASGMAVTNSPLVAPSDIEAHNRLGINSWSNETVEDVPPGRRRRLPRWAGRCGKLSYRKRPGRRAASMMRWSGTVGRVCRGFRIARYPSPCTTPSPNMSRKHCASISSPRKPPNDFLRCSGWSSIMTCPGRPVRCPIIFRRPTGWPWIIATPCWRITGTLIGRISRRITAH